MAIVIAASMSVSMVVPGTLPVRRARLASAKTCLSAGLACAAIYKGVSGGMGFI